MVKLYAAWHGDEFLIVDTVERVAEYLGISERSVYFYTTPTYRKRRKTSDCFYIMKVEVEE